MLPHITHSLVQCVGDGCATRLRPLTSVAVSDCLSHCRSIRLSEDDRLQLMKMATDCRRCRKTGSGDSCCSSSGERELPSSASVSASTPLLLLVSVQADMSVVGVCSPMDTHAAIDHRSSFEYSLVHSSIHSFVHSFIEQLR